MTVMTVPDYTGICTCEQENCFRDEHHLFHPRRAYKRSKLAWEFRGLRCADWPNVQKVCFHWHHNVYDHFSPPAMPPAKLMREAVNRHASRKCGCYTGKG